MLNPRFIDSLSWNMAEVYGAVTDRILTNLARYFPYIKDPKDISGAFQYQARMLARMGQVNRETADIIMDGLKGADAALRKSLEAAILEALKDTTPALQKAAKQGLLTGAGGVPPEVLPSEMQAFQAYYRQAADHLNLVNTVMLESTEDAYRATVSDITQKIQRTQSILNAETGNAVAGVSSWNQAMRQAVDKMVQNGITGFIDHGGHRWAPETYAAMDIRTTLANTARQAVWEQNGNFGNDLYQVSSHAGARPLCYPWQAKVISSADMERDVEDGDGNKIHVYAQSATSYGEPAGLFGINCRHYPTPFIAGVSTITGAPQDEEENEKAYALSQEQRAMERRMRELRRDVDVLKAQGAGKDELKAARAKVREQSDKIDAFCETNDLPRRRDREYVPVNATFPDKSTYNPAEFRTEQRDRMREFFGGKNNQRRTL